MSLQTVARRYASALADVVIERGEQAEIQKELAGWASLMNSSALLAEVFSNPTVPHDQKRRLLDELISRTKVKETTGAFLRVLLTNQRLPQLIQIAERFNHVLDERAGVVSASVTTARPLPEQSKESLESALGASTGKAVRLNFLIDEDIVAGVVTQIGSTVFDGSVRNQLERMAAELANA
ncbi:MAG: ATP synthase F1 subunit delta [Pyrinomonadaceae bacterium]